MMQFGEQPAKTLTETVAPLFASFRRYWRMAIGPAAALLTIGLVLAWRLPSYYSADARILIQPQRINSKLLEETEQDKDAMKTRLDGMTQEILSRPRLRSVIDKLQVYPDLKGIRGGEKALVKFRSNIEIAPVQSASGGVAQQVFQLTFQHNDPKVAFEVTKALSNLFIEESLVDQRSEAQGAEEFFDSQLNEARKKLEEMEDKRQEFISTNFGKLPEHLEQAMAQLQTLSAQLDTNTQLMAANMARRANLETLLQEARRIAPTGGPSGQSMSNDPGERLSQLEQALVILKSRYSEEHPDVQKTRNQISALKEEIRRDGGSSSAASAGGNGNSQMAYGVRKEMSEVEVQLTGLREENKRLKQKIDELQANIQEMPVKEQDLLKINRDYANIKSSYERLLAAREQAGLQTSLIRSQKGTQFRIVDPVEMPRIPAGPPRMIIAVGGIALSIMAFLALPIGLYFVNGSYRMKEDLEFELGVPVLGVIPPMVTPEAVGFERRLSITSFLVSLASAAVVSVVIFVVV